ncbi:MAG: M48 family metalloprotease [Elusimicrobia bacterium]|nr:M48 family metalloprotease [Elusimicrobiota bacterium]
MSKIPGIFERKHEDGADRYSLETYSQPLAMINALKKLTVENLSNLKPHPLKVFIHYSHPPVLERIKFINSLA